VISVISVNSTRQYVFEFTYQAYETYQNVSKRINVLDVSDVLNVLSVVARYKNSVFNIVVLGKKGITDPHKFVSECFQCAPLF
jgi:hypothetical protein